MKYLVLFVLSALMTTKLLISEDPLIPVGTPVETLRTYCSSAFLQSFAGLNLVTFSFSETTFREQVSCTLVILFVSVSSILHKPCTKVSEGRWNEAKREGHTKKRDCHQIEVSPEGKFLHGP